MKEVAEFYDGIAEQYDLYYTLPVDLAEDALTAEILCRHIAKGDYVLDVGCGTGHTLTMVQPSYYVGLDISPAMIQRAEDRWPRMPFALADMEDLSDFRGFDVITCLNEVGLYALDYPAFVEELCVTTSRAVVLSVPLPAHRHRHTLSEACPGKHYLSYREVVEPFERMFKTVDVTTYSSGWVDRMPKKWLDRHGVTWPRWLAPYYCIIEAAL